MATPFTFVLTDQPFQLNCRIQADPDVPQGCTRLLFRLGDRVIGRSLCVEAVAEGIHDSDLLAAPRMLGLLAEEKEEGVLGTLMALVPTVEFDLIRTKVRRTAGFDLAESMIHFPAGTIRPAEQLPFEMVGLGRAIRAAELRNHPGHLENEAADILARILFDREYVSEEQKAINDLLDSIE